MSLLNHGRNHCLGYDKRRIQVHIYHLSELCRGHLAHGDSLNDACVIDENVNHADLLLDRCNHAIDSILIGDITYISMRVNAFFLVCRNALVHKLLLDIVKYMVAPASAIAFAIAKPMP